MRSFAFVAVSAVVVLLIAGAVAVYAYDEGRADRVAEGVLVGDVDVGGLDREAAHARLRDELVEPLSAPVVVRARGKRFRLTAERAGVEVDIDGSVEEAIRRSRRGNVLTRAYRGLTGGRLDDSVEPDVSYSDGAVEKLVARVERKVERKPRDASVQFAAAGLRKVTGRSGLKVDGEKLRERVQNALLRRTRRTVVADVERTKPKVTTKQLADRYETVITIDRGAYTLRLFKRLELVQTYPIAVGQVGLETPAGLYNVQNKAVDPAWHVPNRDWAGDLAGTVVPGGVPENPLKARWMGIYNGAGIHGTDARGSIGTNASHGCIRMLIEDVVELYDQVPVGAPVYIA